MAWGSNGNAERKLKARLRAERRPCHLCHQPIDYSLPARDPWSFEVDHLKPKARGGALYDYENVDAAHRICNERKGKKMPGDDGAREIRRTRLF